MRKKGTGSKAKQVLVSDSSRNSARNSDLPAVNQLKENLYELSSKLVMAEKERQEIQRQIQPFSKRSQQDENRKYVAENRGAAAWVARRMEMESCRLELLPKLKDAIKKHEDLLKRYRGIEKEISQHEACKPNLRDMVNGLEARVCELESELAKLRKKR